MLTAQEALVSLATAASGAAVDALRALAPEDVAPGPVSVALPGRDPLAGVDVPAIVASMSFPDGGGATFVVPVSVARRLAAAVHGEPAPEDAGTELAEPELDAYGQTARRAMEAVAAATGTALDLELTVEDVDVRTATTARDIKVGFHGATRATLAIVQIFGETCRLVQLVPSAHAMLLTAGDGGHGDEAARTELDKMLREVKLRVWAEVGRTRLRSAEVASLSDGAIIELDRAAEDPVDLYVNGSRIATGRLVCIDGKEWAVRLEQVFPSAEADPAAA